MSTIFSSSKSLSFNLSAIQPRTPTFKWGLDFFTLLYSVSLLRIVCSALSLIEHVFTSTKSASSNVWVVLKPSVASIEATISLSEKFMAQP